MVEVCGKPSDKNLNINYEDKLELTLFKKEPLIPINSEELIPIVENLSEKIILDVFQKDEHFKFYRTKQ
jgi:hypothetical protein